MRPVLTILAAASVASCATTPSPSETASPAAEKPREITVDDRYSLHECTGELDHDTWTLSCPQFVVSRTLIDWDQTWTQELILNTTLATLRQGAETVGTTSDRSPAPALNVDGGHGYRMKIETGEPPMAQTFGMTTYARPIGERQVVGVICMDLQQTTTERCEDISVWFASTVPEIAWVDVSKPTQFAGRRLSAPPGCEVDGDSTIACTSGAEMLWFERLEDDTPTAHLDELDVVARAIVKVNQQRTGLNPTPQEQAFGCRLDGELAECVIYRYDYEKNALYVVIGHGKVRGVDVGVLCDWTSNLGDDIPMPCSLIVDPSQPESLTKEL